MSASSHGRTFAALLAGGVPSLAVVSAVIFAQRLALPFSVLWLGEGEPWIAAIALFGAVALSFVRARAADRLGARVRENLLELYLRPFEQGPASELPPPEVVTARLSTALPTVVNCAVDGLAAAISAAFATPVVAALLAHVVGPWVLLPLGIAGAVGAAFTMATSRRVEASWTFAWELSRAFLEALSEGYAGAVDLRAHGHARAYADRLRQGVRGWSAAEGRARVVSATATWGTLGATALAGLAVSAILGPKLETGDPYRTFLLVLTAVPTLQTFVAATGTMLSARDEIANAARQREVARLATEAEADEPIDATAEIRLMHVDYAYRADGARSTVALKGVTFQLAPGESVAIVGPNGAGKTTLLYVLLGVVRPDRGTIEVDGREARLDNRRFRARLAFLSQRPFELPTASIADNLRAFEPEARAEDLLRALSTVGLWSTLRARAESDEAALALPYSALSRGQARRVMLARALLRDADLLVLDEPEAHLDPESVVELAEILRQAAKRRRVIAVVHDRTLAAFADRVIELAPPSDRKAQVEG